MTGGQSIAEVERTCERNALAEAEAYMSEHYGEPTARECFERCRHQEACLRIFGEVCHMTITEATPDVLGCAEECQEYEE